MIFKFELVQENYNILKGLTYALCLVLFLFFPGIHTVNVVQSPLKIDLASELVAGDLIFSQHQTPLYLNEKSFTHIRETSWQFAVASVYSPSPSMIYHQSITHSNWREGIKNWFRPPVIQWQVFPISLKKRSLTKARDLRLPASVVQNLENADEEQKQEERAKVKKALSLWEDEIDLQCFQYPIQSQVVSQYGSPRTLPNGNQYYHLGLDLRARSRVPILPMGAGSLVLTEEMIVPGKNSIVYHGGGLYSRYMHLSKFHRKSGEQISSREYLGVSGNTGRSQAPHLHFEIIWKGNHASPGSFLQKWEQICDRG